MSIVGEHGQDFQAHVADGRYPPQSFDAPYVIIGRLEDIEEDLANRQILYEQATRQWYAVQREVKKAFAEQMLRSTAPTVPQKKADADLKALTVDGIEVEGLYEALKVVIDVLKTRASICQSLLRAQANVS